jgi:glycosyltransferase involved in cell wall biosynthesis
MNIAVIQAYPSYHAGNTSPQEWIQNLNREKWIPGILRSIGHEVEYWIGAHTSGSFPVSDEELPSYTLRHFTTDEISSQTKKHICSEMVDFARQQNIDHYLIKGIDGGIGMHLLDEYILPSDIPFSFIIGGEFYNKYVPKAKYIFYETEYQKQKLLNPGWHFYRRRCSEKQLIRLEKSIDIRLFRPIDKEIRWDIISVGRLIPNYKNFDDMCSLSDKYKVAIIGDGSHRSTLVQNYPQTEFLGYKPNAELPDYLNQARIFFYSGKRDHNPRVITEAMACGLPVIAYRSIITNDVLPPACGYLIDDKNFEIRIPEILSSGDELQRKGKNARTFTKENRGKFSTRSAFEQAFS